MLKDRYLLIISVVISLFFPGQEPSEFWEALGGKGSYAKARQEVFELERPRLFKCSDALGAFNITEISPFSQEDLDDTDVMMLGM